MTTTEYYPPRDMREETEQSPQASTPETGCFDASGASSNRGDFTTSDLLTDAQISSAGALE